MSLDIARRFVSGHKARFQDEELGADLDLVYVTDRIIIMGYPATGFASLYRNRRRDVLKFLNARHDRKWWIWNLCPLYENAYAAEAMEGRVSRYPFPDHHAPPLPLLPLAVREMTAWLEGDPERVAIIHCKAGKGRSGTLLCSYMLSLPSLPPPPQKDQSYTQSERLKRLALADNDTSTKTQDDGWIAIGQGSEVHKVQIQDSSSSTSPSSRTDDSPSALTPTQSTTLDVPAPDEAVHLRSGSPSSSRSSITTISRLSHESLGDLRLESNPPYAPIDVSDEGRPEAAGQADRKDGRVEEVFKLHSSRRMKPSSKGRGVSIPSQRRWCRYVHLLFTKQAPLSYLAPPSSKPPRVKLTSITLVMHPPSGWKKPLASLIIGGHSNGEGKAWIKVARYDDSYVEELQKRGGGGEGVGGTQVTWGGVGAAGQWDSDKMFRGCGKLSETGETPSDANVLPHGRDHLIVHHCTPNTSAGDIVLDRSRELRLKLHMGSLPMGWAWMIPAFHLPEPLPASSTPQPKRVHSLHFPRSQIDFALGAGALIKEMIVRLEEVPPDETSLPIRTEQTAGEDEAEEAVTEDGEGSKVGTIAAGVVGAVEGKGIKQGKEAAEAQAA